MSGSSVQYWEKVLGSPFQYGEKVVIQYWEKFLGSPIQYWVKVVYILKPNTGKGSIGSQSSTGKRFYRFPSPVMGKVLCVPKSNTR